MLNDVPGYAGSFALKICPSLIPVLEKGILS